MSARWRVAPAPLMTALAARFHIYPPTSSLGRRQCVCARWPAQTVVLHKHATINVHTGQALLQQQAHAVFHVLALSSAWRETFLHLIAEARTPEDLAAAVNYAGAAFEEDRRGSLSSTLSKRAVP
jgi:hypothetical protein